MRWHVAVCASFIGTVATLPVAAETIFVSNEKDNSVSIVDGATLEVIKTVQVGQRPRGVTLSIDNKYLFICASDDNVLFNCWSDDNHVEVMDTTTYEIVKTLPSGPDPELFVLSPSGNPLYIANEDDNMVTVVDVEAGNVLAEVPVGVEPEGMGIS